MNTQKAAAPEIDGAALGVLTEHRKGGALSDLSQGLRDVAGAVRLTGKSGYVSLKLKVAVAQGTGGTLVISDEVKASIPRADKEGSIFYADHNNNLVRNDPDQTELPGIIVDVQQTPNLGLAPQPKPAVVDLAKPIKN